MSIVHTDAIVLKYVEFSESSLILTLFTRNFGKIRSIAKGARRLKNPFESALDLLAQISVSFISKNSEALDLLTEAKLRNRFRPNRKNLGGMYAACYLVELLDSFTEIYQPIPELYAAAEKALAQFQLGAKVERHLLTFEWALLNCLGYEPSLNFCVECGQTISLEQNEQAKKRIPFAFVEGGVVCSECYKNHEFQVVTSVSGSAIRLLKELEAHRIEETQRNKIPGYLRELNRAQEQNGTDKTVHKKETELEEMLKETSEEEEPVFSKSVRGEVRGLMNTYISHLLGRKPGMYDYLNKMIKEPQ